MNAPTPAFIVFLLLLGIGIIAAKKEYIIIPIIIAMCFLPADRSIQIATLDFRGIRVMALIGILKVYSSIDYRSLRLNTIDKLFILCSLLGALIYITASQNKLGAFIYQVGVCIDSIILYLVFRYTIQSEATMRLIIKTFCICVVVLLPFTIFEFSSARNLFSILGRSEISIRAGEIRAACTFSHSILFGSFAATLIPIFWADLMFKRSLYKIIALCSCIFFVYACSSSTPIVALATGICCLLFFNWKQHSKFLAWFMVFAAIFVHMVLKMPLWHTLYVRIALKASSTGHHRYMLTEAAIREFWNWWLIGYGDAGPQWHLKYWPWAHARFTDMTNHYLLVGVRGGFLTMMIFIFLCYKVIKILGLTSISNKDKNSQWLWWGYTVMMIIHCVSFLSVAYFGQITMLLYLTIAVASFAYDEKNINLSLNTHKN